MIGVAAPPSDVAVVREFFELFKTPWQMYREDSDCEVLLCATPDVPSNSARLLLVFGAEEGPFDRAQKVPFASSSERTTVSFAAGQFPIHGACRTFGEALSPVLVEQNSGSAAGIELSFGGQKVVRVGYDLFGEIRHLLACGQTAEFARIPTLELHIAFLREVITSHGVSLFEIPPLPAGYEFVACLTHDVDHPLMRNHCCDHTMLGFVARALGGSLIDWLRGRKPFRQVVASYRAVFSLPLVYFGMAPDFWNLFQRYVELEKGARSTFFVIPEKGNCGRDRLGRRPRKRAAKYALAQIADELRRLLAAGREIAVHGIDAWRDVDAGRAELAKIRAITGAEEMGIRMHWLFFDEKSAARLEEAGYSYDSTVGYNDAVGYRAGTLQIFRPLGVERLLELPMHVMDTAMFYPSYMGLSQDEAEKEIDGLLDNARRFGGVLTVNWHDRSLGPERFWNESYEEFVAELNRRKAWMPTASEAVAWFRRRRAAVMEVEENADRPARVTVSVPDADASLPGLRLRAHFAGESSAKRKAFVDFFFDRSSQFEIELASPATAAA